MLHALLFIRVILATPSDEASERLLPIGRMCGIITFFDGRNIFLLDAATARTSDTEIFIVRFGHRWIKVTKVDQNH